MLLEKTANTIEALLFIKGEEGVTTEFLSSFLELKESEAENMLNIFLDVFNDRNSALMIKKYGNIYKMVIKENIYEEVKNAIVSKNLVKLSKSSLETLAIIAYNQPITKLQIEQIRGVNSDSIIYSLLNKELIISTKTLDVVGKPKLYETTDLFLDVFGLESLEHLPQNEENNINEQLKQFLQD